MTLMMMRIAPWSMVGERFMGSQELVRMGKELRDTNKALIKAIPSTASPELKEVTAELKRLVRTQSRIMDRTGNAVYRILYNTAHGIEVSDKDLDVMTAALNLNRGPIRFDPNLHTYRRLHQEDASVLAELLLEYLNIGITVHSVCQREGCGRIMTAGRGSKKFCSAECRKEHWSYKNQKRYYLEKQKESLANKERNSRNRKPNEESSNGGDDEVRQDSEE